MMRHPLHLAVAEAIAQQLPSYCKLLRDPACGGSHNLPLFAGFRKGNDTEICNVDLLILSSKKIRMIVEIEESGFLPTKICGKFFQAALATHFIHQSHKKEGPIPYAEKVLFIQVIDRSKLPLRTRKELQGELIEQEIQKLLPLRGITDYRLVFVAGKDDASGLAAVGEAVRRCSEHA